MRNKFLKKNNRKKVAISVCSLALVAIVSVFCIYHSKILAGVFQAHKDDNGNVTYTAKNTIRVLEVVAQNGQQILGYTVEGSEPITVQQIESYTGTISDFEDFKNATGYEIEGTPGNYKVKSSGNSAFGENVLADQMYAESDSIMVDVIEAKDFTKENLDGIDMVYINSADYNENLLYYYDQIVNGGSEGIQPGDYGRTYADSYLVNVKVKQLAIETILKAVGRPDYANSITEDIFEKAEVQNYKAYSFSSYLSELGALSVDELTGANMAESLANIDDFILKVNNTLKNKSANSIKPISKKGSMESVTEEEIANMIVYIRQGEYLDFAEVNVQAYVEKIVTSKAYTNNRIKQAINKANKAEYKTALAYLIGIKSGDIVESENIEEYRNTVAQAIGKVLYDIYTTEFDGEKCIEANISAYADEFLKAETVVGGEEVFYDNLLNLVVKPVNEIEKEKAFELISSTAANAELVGQILSDRDSANILFKRTGLESYRTYNLENYLNAFGAMTDENALKSMQENEEGEYVYKYDSDKIESELKAINDSSQGIDTSCDMTWSSAIALYDYVTTGGAFVYNADLLSSGKIGNYNVAEGSANNLYKILLVLRQLRTSYFNETVRPSIDANGCYVDSVGNSINSWYAGTFCTSWKSETVDFTKYREPQVVGKLYDEAGNVIGDVVYIDENVFSYSGASYFGGGTFWNEDYNADTGISDGNLEKYNIKNKRLYISSTDLKDGNHWWYQQAELGNQYIYYRYTDTEGKTVEEYKKVDKLYKSEAYMYYVDIPVTTNRVYVFINNSTWKDFNRTENYNNVANLADGSMLYIKAGNGFVGKTTSPIDGRTNLNDTRFNVDKGSGTHEPSDTNIEYSGSGKYTKGEAIRKIMNISLNQLQSIPFKVLEVHPMGNVSDFNSYAGAVELASYLKVDIPGMDETNYKDYFDVESISVAEFNTRHEDLNGRYDLIYIGKQTGLLYSKMYKSGDNTVKRTIFGDGTNNDCTVMGENYYMNGLVYYGIGSSRVVGGSLRGTVASDYVLGRSTRSGYYNDHKIWKNLFFAEYKSYMPGYNNTLSQDENTYYVLKSSNVSTRLSGNDLTVERMNDLLAYLKAGYPVMFDDGLLDADDDTKYTDCYDKALTTTVSYDKAVKWRYVDKNSKMYAFIQQAKSIGKDSNGEYTVTKAAMDGVLDGKAYVSLVSRNYAANGRNPDKLSADEKFNGGLSYAVKRNEQVDFEILKGPQEYDKDKDGNDIKAGSTGTYLTDMNSCKFKLKAGINRENTLQWIIDNYDFHMYIDKSGTANFEEDSTIELDLVEPNPDEKNNIIEVGMKNGKWPTGIEGLIAWKIVAVSKTNDGNRWEHVGYSAFKQKQAKDVYVLWVKTNNTNLDFDEMIQIYDGKDNDVIPEYNIKVDTIAYSDFVNNWKNENTDNYSKANSLIKVGKLKNVSKKRTLSGDDGKEYNMIVFGYCDSYAGLDINNIQCLKNIDYFVHTAKKSLLFAHDNASYMTTFNYYTDNGSIAPELSGNQNFSTNFARYTTSYMRGMLGMDQYGSSYSALAFDENLAQNYPNEKDGLLSWLYTYTPSLANARSYLGIDNIANPTQEELSDMRGITNGQLFRYSTTAKDFPYRSDNGLGSVIGSTGWQQSFITTKHIEATNKGQINIYPFNIGDEADLSALTHYQYTRLDVEDEDTTVWYTLSTGTSGSQIYNAEKGDGSNNFYIYSKGNITYTGAGHSLISKDSLETKLFVNTVIAAIKVGDFAPDVVFTDATSVNGKDVIYGYDTEDKLAVTYKATDYGYVEGETDRFTDIKIFLDKKEADTTGKLVSDGIYSASNDIILNDGTGYLKNQDGSNMTIGASDVINRQDKTFYLSYADLKQLCIQYVYNGSDPYAWQQGITDSKYVKDLFDKYSISVVVLSKAEEERYNEEKVERPDEKIENYYQGATTDVILRSLFNLD